MRTLLIHRPARDIFPPALGGSSFLLSGMILNGFHAAAVACSLVQRNSVPSTQMRCIITALTGIDCPNEDYGPVVPLDVGRMCRRPVQSADKMRRGFGGFIKSGRDTRSGRTGNGDGPEQRLLWYRTGLVWLCTVILTGWVWRSD
jgi:hypothetical protein